MISLLRQVWQVRYNVFHDQLVLTAGSDARVVLTSAASLSSEPFGKLMSDDKDNDEGNLIYLKLNFNKNKPLKTTIIFQMTILGVLWRTV
jgi:hypothetical protein